MIELNPEQRQAVAHGEPVCIIDPSTHDTYILVRAEVYVRLAAWACFGGSVRDWRQGPRILGHGLARIDAEL